MIKRCCISGVRSVFPHLLDTKVYNKCYIYNKCCTKKSNKV